MENHRLPSVTSAGIECDRESKAEELEIKETVKHKGVSVSDTSESDKKTRNIIVIDHIKEAQKWQSSKSIRGKLDQVPEMKDIEFTYSLPRGGIALHCSTEEAEKLLNNWPEKVFDEQEGPHHPKEKVLCSVGYLKNI